MEQNVSRFQKKVCQVVRKIPPGRIATYKEVAKKAGFPNAWRAVGGVLRKNKNPNIPCHRVIKSDFSIGGFQGQKRNYWKKAGLLLKEGVIGVIPTDTIYGIVGSALDKKAVKKIYKLKRRSPKKQMIILISSLKELEKFKIRTDLWQRKILKKFWPGKITFILRCFSQKFSYLYQDSNTLAFRVPNKKNLLELLSITGPLVAPSANWEGYAPADTISKAKKYFGKNVFYLNEGKKQGKPSTLVQLTGNKAKILRKGACFYKISQYLKNIVE